MNPARYSLHILLLLTILSLLMAGCSDDGTSPSGTSGGLATASLISLSSPARISGFDAETLLVSDYQGEAIHFVNKDSLQPVRSFPVKGRPTGIASASNLIFVGNRSIGSADVYDIEGNFLYHLGGKSNLFGRVNDLDVDSFNRLVYVLDVTAGEVRVFNFDGSDTGFSFGSSILHKPSALSFDSLTGYLLISDFGDPGSGILPGVRIVDVSAGAAQVDELIATNSGNWFSGASLSLSVPQGTALVDNNLFVVDSGAGEVQVYDLASKQPSAPIGSRGTGDGQLFHPLDVFIDALNKDVFVADNLNGRISVFRGAGEVP